MGSVLLNPPHTFAQDFHLPSLTPKEAAKRLFYLLLPLCESSSLMPLSDPPPSDFLDAVKTSVFDCRRSGPDQGSRQVRLVPSPCQLLSRSSLDSGFSFLHVTSKIRPLDLEDSSAVPNWNIRLPKFSVLTPSLSLILSPLLTVSLSPLRPLPSW